MIVSCTIEAEEMLVVRNTDELIVPKIRDFVYRDFPLQKYTFVANNLLIEFYTSPLMRTITFRTEVEFPVQREWNF